MKSDRGSTKRWLGTWTTPRRLDSWIARSRFSTTVVAATFDGMSGDPELQRLRWSIRRLIELIDEGIDSAGEQLSRGESYRAWRTPAGTNGRDDPDSEDGPGLSP